MFSLSCLDNPLVSWEPLQKGQAGNSKNLVPGILRNEDAESQATSTLNQ